MPGKDIIDGFRGTLDFYVSRGVICVRAWPRGKNAGIAPGALLYQPAFARVNRLKKHVSATLQTAYNRYTVGGSNTWADQCIVTYFGNNAPNDLPLP